MTKVLNQTIRTLKRALKELDYVEVENYDIGNEGYTDTGFYFNEYLNVARDNVKVLIDDLEDKYQKMHKIGSYRGE